MAAKPLTPPKDLCSRLTINPTPPKPGGFSDVYEGWLAGEHGGATIAVAIKVLRSPGRSDQAADFKRKFQRECHAWQYLDHPNILKFLGVATVKERPGPTFVSPYCKNGTVVEYLAGSGDLVDRLSLASLKGFIICTQMGFFMHNVLIDDHGQPLLADFGRSQIVGLDEFTRSPAHSPRHTAPEILLLDIPELQASSDTYVPLTATNESDVYSLGMTALEASLGRSYPPHSRSQLTSRLRFTYARLFFGCGLHTDIYRKAAKYADMVERTIWQLLSKLWVYAPKERMKLGDALKQLKSMHRQRTTTAPTQIAARVNNPSSGRAFLSIPSPNQPPAGPSSHASPYPRSEALQTSRSPMPNTLHISVDPATSDHQPYAVPMQHSRATGYPEPNPYPSPTSAIQSPQFSQRDLHPTAVTQPPHPSTSRSGRHIPSLSVDPNLTLGAPSSQPGPGVTRDVGRPPLNSSPRSPPDASDRRDGRYELRAYDYGTSAGRERGSSRPVGSSVSRSAPEPPSEPSRPDLSRSAPQPSPPDPSRYSNRRDERNDPQSDDYAASMGREHAPPTQAPRRSSSRSRRNDPPQLSPSSGRPGPPPSQSSSSHLQYPAQDILPNNPPQANRGRPRSDSQSNPRPPNLHPLDPPVQDSRGRVLAISSDPRSRQNPPPPHRSPSQSTHTVLRGELSSSHSSQPYASRTR
ncbi:hypothetical protein JAAARDRAFT_198117 [Jaapia argillacea MUCL 33604]|uniref:Protein kinase domain-containing protein n=1 Tax=Jaapia argillacea MUCL 33604 TaxID=933084 RepID=A0A067PMD7_9AGAM|nr:hypothetical protein JAAARDRAFT_198117 [Jaapia argillacea MUCL 33604]